MKTLTDNKTDDKTADEVEMRCLNLPMYEAFKRDFSAQIKEDKACLFKVVLL